MLCVRQSLISQGQMVLILCELNHMSAQSLDTVKMAMEFTCTERLKHIAPNSTFKLCFGKIIFIIFYSL